MPEPQAKPPIWMVVTLKSGAQIRQLVTGYRIHREPVLKSLSRLEWDLHGDSPANVLELDLGEVVVIHTEYQD